jgi:DNA-binding PadR family transcriptional regulator
MRGRGCGPAGGWPFEGWRAFWGRPGCGEGAERLERGLLRFIVLDVLHDGPRHGYEIIKELEERTHGRYSPSPGTMYPTLQHLSDLGLITSDQEGDRRVYRLTEAGRAEWSERAEHVKGFWARFSGSPSAESQTELAFLADELQELTRTVWGRLRPAIHRGDFERIRQVRLALERCKNEIRSIIAAGSAEGSQE